MSQSREELNSTETALKRPDFIQSENRGEIKYKKIHHRKFDSQSKINAYINSLNKNDIFTFTYSPGGEICKGGWIGVINSLCTALHKGAIHIYCNDNITADELSNKKKRYLYEQRIRNRLRAGIEAFNHINPQGVYIPLWYMVSPHICEGVLEVSYISLKISSDFFSQKDLNQIITRMCEILNKGTINTLEDVISIPVCKITCFNNAKSDSNSNVDSTQEFAYLHQAKKIRKENNSNNNNYDFSFFLTSSSNSNNNNATGGENHISPISFASSNNHSNNETLQWNNTQIPWTSRQLESSSLFAGVEHLTGKGDTANREYINLNSGNDPFKDPFEVSEDNSLHGFFNK